MVPVEAPKCMAWVFGDIRRQFSVLQLAARILDELRLWMLARRGTAGADRAGEGVNIRSSE